MTKSSQAALPLVAAPEMAVSSLRGLERFAVPFFRWLNTSGLPKDIVQFFVRHVSARWVRWVTGYRWKLMHFERVKHLNPTSSVLLVSNHRSFFDMYVTCSSLYTHTRILDRLYFPVRAKFFYDSAIGALVNLSVSGGAMWPPVFRDDRRRELNPIGTDQMKHVLQNRGTAIGIHPEGTRGKGDDPWQLLPCKPGVGELVHAAPDDALILPFFIIGLSNDFVSEVKSLWRRDKPEIRIRWCEPITAGELKKLGSARLIAEHLHERIGTMAQLDRSEFEDAAGAP